jgi:hypothetical protein
MIPPLYTCTIWQRIKERSFKNNEKLNYTNPRYTNTEAVFGSWVLEGNGGEGLFFISKLQKL